MNRLARSPLFRLAVFVLAAGFGAGCGGNAGPAAPSTPATGRGIVVLGDSLAVSPTPEASFPAVLATRLAQEGFQWTLTNASVSGDTTADGRLRLGKALASDTRVLVLELGANDGLQGVNPENIERNLAAIIDAARQRGIDVLLCGMETPPLHGLRYTIEFHNLFPSLAQRYELPLVPFLLDGIVLNPDFVGSDGVHPNAAGARRIAETVWPFLRAMLVSAEGGAG